jgi:hypothetical protein
MLIHLIGLLSWRFRLWYVCRTGRPVWGVIRYFNDIGFRADQLEREASASMEEINMLYRRVLENQRNAILPPKT